MVVMLLVRRWLNNHFFVINGNTTYKNDRLEVISGFSYSKYDNDHYGEVIWGSDLASNVGIRDHYYDSTSNKYDWSAFSKATFNVSDNLKAYVDLQGRIVKYKTVGLTSDRDPININKNYSFFNPKVGLTYNINEEHSLYASYAKANREPNRNDFEGGNSKHESLDDYEFGWRLKNKTVKLSTNVYYMNYKNQLILTGAIDSNTGEPLRASSGSSYRLGIEIDADIKLSEQVSMRPNISFSDNVNRSYHAKIDGIYTKLREYNNYFFSRYCFRECLCL